jgi:fused signal recognition particle receptor
MSDLLNKWKKGLSRTRDVAFGRIASVFGTSQVTSETWEELESMLIQADMGVDESTTIITALKKVARERGIIQLSDLTEELRSLLLKSIEPTPEVRMEPNPFVIMVVGVNGSGKTTTIAKLASRFSKDGRKVLLVAADTFRAAAVDQLQVWGERLNLTVIAGQQDADPGSVAYDGIQAAVARQYEVVLVDTAGRLHTRYNLMEELKKVQRVIGKALQGAPHATWLVMDASTGQNAIAQAKAFTEAVHVTGIILAKLDTSAKGGMVFAIQRQFGIPILFAGLGETEDAIESFDRNAFIDGILEGMPAVSGG